jgi:hypothetical protein
MRKFICLLLVLISISAASADGIVFLGGSSQAPGVSTNVLGNGGAPVAANYQIAPTDCGKTIQAGTGSTGFFTLTLPPGVSGFSPTCVVTIKDGDAARGKLLSGFPSDLGGGFNILWPGQTAIVGIVNGAWATLLNPGVWQASGSVVLNVDHAAGSDSNNDCLGTGAGACAHIYNAYLIMQTMVRPGNGGSATIFDSNAGETFTETPPAAFLGPTLTAGGNGGVLFLNLNGAIWNTAGINIDDGAVISASNGTIQCAGSGQTAVSVPKGGLFVIGGTNNLTFGACPAGAQMQVFNGANIVADSGYIVSAIGNYHIICNSGGNFSVAGKTISVPNALTFNSWISGNSGCNANFAGTTFTGTGSGSGSTGTQYDFHSNSTIVLSGATLPGATAGTVDTGACLNITGPCAVQPVATGGTGLTTLTAHSVMLGEGTSSPAFIAPVALNKVLTDQGPGNNPAMQSLRSFIYGSSQGTIAASNTDYCWFACGGGTGANALTIAAGGTFKNLSVAASTNPGAGQTFTIFLYFGGQTIITCVISGSSQNTCSDSTHTLTGAAGNAYWLQIATSSGATTASFSYSIEFDYP